MDYQIRKAKEEDLQAVIELAVEAIEHSLSNLRQVPKTLVRELRRKDLQSLYQLIKLPHVGIFVAEDPQQKFLGHVIVLSDQIEAPTGESQGWIFDLSVIPEYWGAGLAQKLMETAENFIKERGLKYIGLSVTSANHRAVRFYEKQDYKEERKRMIKVLE
jgi:ribosomal protein S18 acetylase RimI-like enzyme